MKKYYNIEIAYNTKEMIDRVDNFRTWLYDNNIKHEISAAGDFVHFVHFEILLSEILCGSMVLLTNKGGLIC